MSLGSGYFLKIQNAAAVRAGDDALVLLDVHDTPGAECSCSSRSRTRRAPRQWPRPPCGEQLLILREHNRLDAGGDLLPFLFHSLQLLLDLRNFGLVLFLLGLDRSLFFPRPFSAAVIPAAAASIFSIRTRMSSSMALFSCSPVSISLSSAWYSLLFLISEVRALSFSTFWTPASRSLSRSRLFFCAVWRPSFDLSRDSPCSPRACVRAPQGSRAGVFSVQRASGSSRRFPEAV